MKRTRNDADIETESDDEYTPDKKNQKILTQENNGEDSVEYSDDEEEEEENNEFSFPKVLMDFFQKSEEMTSDEKLTYYKDLFTNDIDISPSLNFVEKIIYKEKIKTYLDNIYSTDSDIIKILKMNLDDSIKTRILRTVISIKESPDNSLKLNEWMDRLLKIPFGTYEGINMSMKNNTPEEIEKYLLNIKSSFDSCVYGQENVKETLLEILTKKIVNSETKGQCIGLFGPPGIGKTSLIQDGLSKALGRPCISISMAGMKDSNILSGHSYTYEGAKHGRVLEAIYQAECMNPIIFLDELDKIDTKDGGLSIIYKLIEITDFSQNHKYEDSYFSGIPIDLSKCTFIVSMNNVNSLNSVLLDRIEIINVSGFEQKDKIQIAKNFLIPQELKLNNFKSNEIVFTTEIIKTLIYNYTDSNDKGVRKLKEIIKKIIRKLSILRFTKKLTYTLNTKDSNNIIITKEITDILLKGVSKRKMLSYYM